MRLIDADALKQGFESSDFDDDPFENVDNACRIVNSYPTIPAIPVEWLQRRRDIYLKAYHAGHESELHTAAILNDTLKAWQKEQEEIM